MTLSTLLFILVFLIGLYFYARCSNPKYNEAFLIIMVKYVALTY